MKYSWPIILIFLFCTICSKTQVNPSLVQLEEMENDTSKINVLNNMAGESYYSNPEDIKYYANIAYQLSEDIHYKKGKAQALNNIGIYYRTQSLYSPAIDNHFNSLHIMEELYDTAGMARCYNLIGIIYLNLENFDLAEEFMLKALSFNELQNDTKWIAGNTNNLGMIFERRGDYPKALKYYIKSLETNLSMGNQNWVSNNYGNIGSLYITLQNYPLAKEYLDKRLVINKQQKDLFGMASTYQLLGKYYIQQQMYKEAVDPLMRSFQLSDSIGSLENMKKTSGDISMVFAKMGAYNNAYQYNKINKLYTDSLNYQENIEKITRLQLQYDFRKNQQLNTYKYDRNWFLYLIFVLSLLSIILFAFYMFLRQRSIAQQHKLKEESLQIDNLKMQDDLNFKEKELEDNLRFLIQKNEFITEIIERLFSLKANIQHENIAFVDEIIADLKSGVTDHIWKDFEMRFHQIQNNFYNNLNIHFPNLTANEKRLCAFLKLNMSTKEISAISKLSIKSIEAARTRLRKKLNLTESDRNLAEYLSNF